MTPRTKQSIMWGNRVLWMQPGGSCWSERRQKEEFWNHTQKRQWGRPKEAVLVGVQKRAGRRLMKQHDPRTFIIQLSFCSLSYMAKGPGSVCNLV